MSANCLSAKCSCTAVGVILMLCVPSSTKHLLWCVLMILLCLFPTWGGCFHHCFFLHLVGSWTYVANHNNGLFSNLYASAVCGWAAPKVTGVRASGIRGCNMCYNFVEHCLLCKTFVCIHTYGSWHQTVQQWSKAQWTAVLFHIILWMAFRHNKPPANGEGCLSLSWGTIWIFFFKKHIHKLFFIFWTRVRRFAKLGLSWNHRRTFFMRTLKFLLIIKELKHFFCKSHPKIEFLGEIEAN